MSTQISRRMTVLLGSAALLASSTVASVAAPAAAAATCDGHVATITGSGLIEGTNGNDVIVGSNGDDEINGRGGKDIICGRDGADTIDGGPKRDRIFGGSGGDLIDGGGGGDDIFGYRGNDLIRGGDGNDFINGGAGTDRCYQGSGSGPIRNCEKADLKVKVIAPAVGSESSAPFKVKVKNRGPRATAYVLFMDEENRHATCNPPWEGLLVDYPKLRPGQTRTRTFEPDCTDISADAWVEVEAEVFPYAKDRRPANNKGKARVDLQE